jgi:hypothetical protein
MRIVVRTSMALVALAAAALSYQSLARLGALCGYGGLSWLYPLVVDAGAAASCATWLHTRGRQPLVMTWVLLAISVLLNGTTHYLTSTGTAPSWLLVVGVAAIPPLVLGLCVHLAVGMGQPLAETPAELHGESPSNNDPVREPELLDKARQVIAVSDGQVGRNILARELDVSPWQARKLLAQVRNNGSAS